MRVSWLGIVCAVLALALAVAVSSYSAGHAHLCAGQCGPPFKLDFTFVHGTAAPAATAALRHCARYPEVVTVGVPYRSRDGYLHATLSTKVFGGAGTRPLLSCLDRSPRVIGAVWPG